MRNRSKYAVAVRKSDGQKVILVKEYHSITEKHPWLGWPFIRGAVNLVESMIVGMGTLMYSANFMDEVDPKQSSKKDAKDVSDNEVTTDAASEAAATTEETTDEAAKADADAKIDADAKPAAESKPMSGAMIGATVALSLVLTVALFIMLPFAITSLLERVTGIDSALFSSVMEGVLRIAIFVGYIALISQMEEIKRVFRYHGAEHKTINCIEHGLELTVDNARASSKEHKRCGTSFMIFVMVISILVFSIVNMFPLYTGTSRILKFVVRFVVRILLLPLVAGISYEFLKLAGRSNNCVVNALSRPGMWMQALTTKEPDDTMLSVAIASVEAVFDWKMFLSGTAAEECATPTTPGEYLIGEDGNYTPTVTGFAPEFAKKAEEKTAGDTTEE
ncbi:MAG: DUF1385 domain-containing protein [Lachnospiraceae bacterium]|nr:DUF1385 domain-containing protein [Lachnospiraceae bacterium]